MIVADVPGGMRLVHQRDHAHQCAGLAEAWGNDAFARISPWGPLVRATHVHDDGWEPWDLAPGVDAIGRPVDFPDLDRQRHIALYRAGIASAVALGPRVGLAVSTHGQGLYEKRMGLDGPRPDRGTRPPHERRFIHDQERLQARLRAELDPEGLAEWEWAAYRLLQAWDVLSLYLCWGGLERGQPWMLRRVPRGDGDADGVTLTLAPGGPGECTVDPWPFGPSGLRSAVRSYTIPAGPYPDTASLRRACAAAEPADHTVVLRPR